MMLFLAPLVLHVLMVFVAMVLVMIAAWAFGLAMKDGGWTDVFWTWGTTATIVGAVLLAFPGTLPTSREWLVAGFMATWGLRLGLYLTPRVATHDEDARYASFREKFGKRYSLLMLFVTLPQAPATALLALSVLVAARWPTGPLGLRDFLALAVFAIAIVGEYVSDNQMKRFRDDPANKGAIMDKGLWAWSRHPNYFFQWLGWLAYPVMCLDPVIPISFASLAAPVVMFLLLRFVSGVPPLEEAMLKTRGDRFRSYQARVSAFFPSPPKAKA